MTKPIIPSINTIHAITINITLIVFATVKDFFFLVFFLAIVRAANC